MWRRRWTPFSRYASIIFLSIFTLLLWGRSCSTLAIVASPGHTMARVDEVSSGGRGAYSVQLTYKASDPALQGFATSIHVSRRYIRRSSVGRVIPVTYSKFRPSSAVYGHLSRSQVFKKAMLLFVLSLVALGGAIYSYLRQPDPV